MTPSEAEAALAAATSSSSATMHAIAPPGVGRIVVRFVLYIVVATGLWWGFSRGSATGWAFSFTLAATFIATMMFIERRNPKARPRNDVDAAIALGKSPTFIAIILLGVVPGVLLMNEPRSVRFIALVVTLSALASVPFVVWDRRKALAQHP